MNTGAHDSASEVAPAGAWSDYWEHIDDKQRVFRIEARDYAARVRRLLQPSAQAHVLDFGCGFAYAGRELAPSVARVSLWDASANVRRQAEAKISGTANIEMLDLENPQQDPAGVFDLILAHSVLQYMSEAQISSWLRRFRGMLAPGGRIALSDLIVPGAGGLGEVPAYLLFALRHGFFWNAFFSGVREAFSYWRAREARPLTVIRREAFEAWAAQAGLEVQWLAENLSHRRSRATAVLRIA